jgi:multidrug transporter EmrE-like cation transporter
MNLQLAWGENGNCGDWSVTKRELNMAWFWLIIGGLFEVGFTTAAFVEGFRNVLDDRFPCLGRHQHGAVGTCCSTIPMGTAYAVRSARLRP